jgi:parvulin-like peptidyl-prolyl isomerase
LPGIQQRPNLICNGGVLPEFGVGTYAGIFEDMFLNCNQGDISKPFATAYGWHILKLLEKPISKTFEDVELNAT